MPAEGALKLRREKWGGAPFMQSGLAISGEFDPSKTPVQDKSTKGSIPLAVLGLVPQFSVFFELAPKLPLQISVAFEQREEALAVFLVIFKLALVLGSFAVSQIS